MRNKHPKAFQFLLSAALAIGTITGAAPIMAQEDTPFDDTVSAEEFAEAYSEETVEDDIALESGEVDEIVMDEQTIGADGESGKRRRDHQKSPTRGRYACAYAYR